MEEGKPQRGEAFIPLGVGPGGKVAAVHLTEGGPRATTMIPVKDGEDLTGKSAYMCRMEGPVIVAEPLWDDRRSSSSGPAMVNSSSYRSGWDGVFGEKKRSQSLN